MGVRLIVMMIVSLGALYTIHLLAQDFTKISSGAGRVASTLFGKRDLDDANRRANITDLEIEFEKKIDWNNILSKDPFNCALSLICQLSAGAEKNNNEANQIYEFITHTIEHTKVPKKLSKAYQSGLDFNKNRKNDFIKCYKMFPLCPYSSKTMMKLITLNKFLFG
ncbi:CLUMA_CG005547, isoform A [Clunio marinus]|uniref:CLUMA_CG005547, isoform A n=1 Tax=Clunio marinus TaxID=568069 RepID=A0A1J1I0L5_9DIPT|nr:CLUMA_CG005547, isoform A [Clunio marinus]